jgi:hypothetical protein
MAMSQAGFLLLGEEFSLGGLEDFHSVFLVLQLASKKEKLDLCVWK